MNPESIYRVEIVNSTKHKVPAEIVKRAVRCTLALENIKPCTVSVAFISHAEIRELNSKYRNVDEPTDVLTFPYEEPTRYSKHGAKPSKFSRKPPLGDIAIAFDFAFIQAHIHKIPFESECTILAIHGALHLAGYDDLTENEQKEMISKSRAVWELMGNSNFPDWYTCDPEKVIERSAEVISPKLTTSIALPNVKKEEVF